MSAYVHLSSRSAAIVRSFSLFGGPRPALVRFAAGLGPRPLALPTLSSLSTKRLSGELADAVSPSQHADLPLLEPAFFAHASRYASPAILSAWRSPPTTLRVDLASFATLAAAVEHLRALAAGRENEAVTVELAGWERVNEWDLAGAGSLRRSDVSQQDWDAITEARRCREWEKEAMVSLPFRSELSSFPRAEIRESLADPLNRACSHSCGARQRSRRRRRSRHFHRI